MEVRFYLLLVIAFWNSDCSNIASANTEHKVHNIVLYPDKHSWCKTTAIKQVIAYPGCDSIEIDNNVCVGACFSYSIPRTVPSSPGEVLPYCDSCQPSNTTLRHVTLKCTSGEFEGESMNKRVEIITNCSCMTCSDPSSRNLLLDSDEELDTPETSDSIFDVPQLFGLMHSSKEKNNSFEPFNFNPARTINDSYINERLVLLLRELNEGVDELSAPNQVALRELLNQVEGDNHKVDDSTLADFVKRVEKEGHVNIDVEHLRQVLIKIENSEHEKNLHHHSHHSSNEHNHNAHRHQHMHGPHHSMVLGPNADGHDMIQSGVFLTPTLDVASHHLKPALAGSELSYHDNLVPADHDRRVPSISSDKDQD
ncbi:uncharacterized protein LOC142326133 [Lycorma delicatula]|uniref:uncharacterized protein LOC142326133 n=1 Tax=Lycorma delicatula TaxID=130591 RepID=UPI003F50EAA7